MLLAGKRVRLAYIALGMCQYEVVRKVARVQRERNEVIYMSLVEPLTAIEALWTVQLLQASTDDR